MRYQALLKIFIWTLASKLALFTSQGKGQQMLIKLQASEKVIFMHDRLCQKGNFGRLFLNISSPTQIKALRPSSVLTRAGDVLKGSYWILICEEI